MMQASPRQAIRFVLLYLFFSLLFAALTICLCFFGRYARERMPTAPADADSITTPAFCVVIDPGHGGEDGGAVGVDGLTEKAVNLRLGELLYTQLRMAGINVIMTRTDDRLLYDPSVDYRGRKKMLDLRARLDLVRDTPEAILISLHQNAFTQAKYSGLQVYYSVNHPDSAQLAELVQRDTVRWLQPDNSRKIKAADSSIYLLDRSTCPAILVECGFLSNPDDCAKLRDEAYLGMLSTTVFAAICEYLSRT